MTATIFMETTRISAERTVAEVQQVLAKHGANCVLLEYESMQIAAVSFKYDVGGQLIPFRLPCRWPAVETVLRKSGKRPRYDDTFEAWARRVAWRQILRWVEAQMAMVDTSMVKVQEVFFPYMQTASGGTVFELAEERGLTALAWDGQK